VTIRQSKKPNTAVWLPPLYRGVDADAEVLPKVLLSSLTTQDTEENSKVGFLGEFSIEKRGKKPESRQNGRFIWMRELWSKGKCRRGSSGWWLGVA